MRALHHFAPGTLVLALALVTPALVTPEVSRAQQARATAPTAGADPSYLYVWATATDTATPAFLAGDTTARLRRRGVVLLAIDLRAGSPTRGRVVNAVVADTAGRVAHHTEHALAADALLFANDFGAGRTHRFDLRVPGAPRRLGDFTTAGPFGYPHSFVRLPGGNVLATYQTQASGQPPGGLAELRRDGSVVRWARAAAPGVDSTVVQPYSLEVIPALDRVVTTSTSMRADIGTHVQVWRLSDLTLLHTLPLPVAPQHAAHEAHAATGAADNEPDAHHRLPGEPRLLADGRTVMLGTFTCGVYRLTGLDGASPRLEFAYAFPGENCAVPARVGRWWVQTVPALRALVTLDVADPARPREVSRLVFDERAAPHWLATDATGRRLVMTSRGARDSRVHFARLDVRTGTLARDPELAEVDLSRVSVPGLGIVRALPHGAVFGPGT